MVRRGVLFLQLSFFIHLFVFVFPKFPQERINNRPKNAFRVYYFIFGLKYGIIVRQNNKSRN